MLAAASSILAADNASDEVHVRRATINDLDDIVALENAAFAADRVSNRYKQLVRLIGRAGTIVKP